MPDVFTNERVFLDVEVEEMVGDISSIVSLDKVRVQEMLDEYADDKPQFPILRITGGLSGNGNNWNDTVLTDVAEQINRDEKPGYWGHIPPADKGYVFPDVETLWLGAKVTNENGKKVLYVKGYNVPGGRARKHRRIAKVVSWAGTASGKVISGVRQIEKFALESIDWARPGSAGMNARVVAVVSEMEGSEEVTELAKVTVDQLRAENPSLFTLVKQEVEKEHEQSVSEMKKKAETADEAESIFSKLRKVLGIEADKDIVEAVTQVVTKVEDIGKGELKDKVLNALTKHIKGGDDKAQERARATVLRLFPVTEMVGKTDDEISKEVESFLSSDEDAKAIVTEMVQSPAPLTGRRQDGKRDDVGKSGMVTTRKVKL